MFRSRVRALGALVAVGLVGALMAPAHAAGTQNIFHVWAADLLPTGCEPADNWYPGDVAVAQGATYVVSTCHTDGRMGPEPETTLVAKIDGSGRIVWSKRTPHLGEGDGLSVTAGDFGAVVSEQAYGYTRLTRYGSGGAQIWQVDVQGKIIYDLEVVNGQLFAGGTTTEFMPSYVARLDLATGAVRGEKTYKDGGRVVAMTEFRGTLVLAVHTSTNIAPREEIALVRRIGPGLAAWWTKQSFNDRILNIDASDNQIFTTRDDPYSPGDSGGLEVLNPDGATVRKVPDVGINNYVMATPGGAVTISEEFVTSYNLDGTQRWQLRTSSDKGEIWGADWNYHGIRVLVNNSRFQLLKITKNDACPC